MSTPLPASSTKHLDVVHHSLPKDHLTSFPLRQISATSTTSSTDGRSQNGSTGTTGTTLWLGGQVLACYLSTLPPPTPLSTTLSRESEPKSGGNATSPRRHAIELGAGVGYLSLVLASLGYNVTSTDIPPVLDTVLRPNITNGLDALSRRTLSTPVFSGNPTATARARSNGPELIRGNVSVQELDWLEPDLGLLGGLQVDLIVTSDTIYHPTLVPALFGTIAKLSQSALLAGKKAPVVYLCLERRDSRLVDSALAAAVGFGVVLKRVGHGRVVKSVERAGWGWKEEDWEGVEIYKGRFAAVGDVGDADDA